MPRHQLFCMVPNACGASMAWEGDHAKRIGDTHRGWHRCGHPAGVCGTLRLDGEDGGRRRRQCADGVGLRRAEGRCASDADLFRQAGAELRSRPQRPAAGTRHQRFVRVQGRRQGRDQDARTRGDVQLLHRADGQVPTRCWPCCAPRAKWPSPRTNMARTAFRFAARAPPSARCWPNVARLLPAMATEARKTGRLAPPTRQPAAR